MLIYGWKTIEQKKSPELGEPCVKCGKHETRLAIVLSYFHIFWIPVFPYRRKMEIDCRSCNYQAQPSELKDLSLQKAKALKRSTMPPLYTFSGAVLILLLIVYFNIQGNETQERELEYVNNPEVGDVYLYKDPTDDTGYPYSFLKVASFNADSIYLKPNSYGYDGYVFKLDAEDAFYNISTSYHRSEVLQMLEKNEIRRVERGWSESSGFGREKEFDFSEMIKGLDTENND